MNPCSVPAFLRPLVPDETPFEQAACALHDETYAVGGSRFDRLEADLRFALRLLLAGMDPDRVEQYLWQVRAHGHRYWNGDDGPGALPAPLPDASEAP